MKSNRVVVALPISCILLAACALPPEGLEKESIGAAQGALVTGNALNPNALNPNALNPNALNPNALSPNALSLSALSLNALSSITDPREAGSLSRELLRYTVGCALDPAQSFSFSWTDLASVVHDETYYGLLGLATGWATAPLNLSGQKMVSACLAARTNYYQIPVIFSARSPIEPLKSNTPTEEINYYDEVEGAFWGNLFSATPYLNSCYNTAMVSPSRLNLRDCAAGHLENGVTSECGIIHITGSCSSRCSSLDNQNKYPSCTEHPEISGSTASTTYVITSALE